MITLTTPVEEIAERYPEAVRYGVLRGVSLVFCVGSYPGTLGDLLGIRGVQDPEEFVCGLNEYLGLTSLGPK